MRNNKRKIKLENGKIIPLTCDFMFAEIFNKEENIDIIESFISSYFDIEEKEIKGKIKILERDLGIENKQEKNKQVDLILEYKEDKINIELNNDGNQGKRDRNVVYASKVHSKNLKYSENDYNNISKTIQINLNNYNCNNEKMIETYYLKNERGDKLTEKLQIDFVDMVKATDLCYNVRSEKEKKIQKWCLTLRTDSLKEFKRNVGGILMSEESKNKLVEEVETLSADEEMICLYTELSDRELTYNTKMADLEKEIEKVENEKEKIESEKKTLEEKTIDIAKILLV